MLTDKMQKGGALTVAAAAEEIGIHHDTLRRWALAGKAVYVSFGGIMFVPVTEVERLKREKKKEAAGKSGS